MSESAPSRRASPLRRLGCVLAVVVWLIFMSLPIFFFQLIFNGQVEFGRDPLNQLRIFLIQEPGQEGVGLQWSRPADDDGLCLRTDVRYLMFSGEADNGQDCTCMGDLAGTPAPAGCAVP